MNRGWFGAGWAAALASIFLLTAQAHAAVDNTRRIDANSISSVVTNHNSYAYDLVNGTAGLEWPKGSGKTAVYAAGLWVGARINEGTRPIVKVGEYSQQWGPGPIVGGRGQADRSSYRVYKIRRGDTPATNPDYAAWPVADGAPVDSLGNPQILGDMTLWSVYNDRAPDAPTNRAGTAGIDDANSLGLEVQQSTFGFSRTGALNNVIFVKYKIINKGTNFLHDTYVSLWADPDMGDGNDDLVGCDTKLSMGFCYNGSNLDGVYGVAPPAVGWDFFKGPLDRVTHKFLPMTSFNLYTNGTDPTSPQQSYNFMRGLDPDGNPITDPTTGLVTTFDVSGDPVKGTGNLDENPGDRRLMMSSGPFEMAPGDTQEVVAGLIVGRGGDYLSSINVVRLFDKEAQATFDANFDLATPPPAPKVIARAIANTIDLSWDALAVSDYQHKVFPVKDSSGAVVDTIIKDYYFQGYNVYQGTTPSGPWKKVATYDLGGEDTVQAIYNDLPDATTSLTQRLLVQNGTNSGLRFHYQTTTDQVNGGRIVNNKPYYFAVTAYNYEADHGVNYVDPVTGSPIGLITETLENDPSQQALEVVPASTTLQLRTVAKHISGTGLATVNVDLFKADTLYMGHDFEVHFYLDSTSNSLKWRLLDLTAHTTVLDAQDDFSGDLHVERELGSMEVRVFRPLPPSSVTYTPAAHDPFTGLSGQWYHGGMDLAENFFGTALNQLQLVPIELHFDPAHGQQAYAYERHGPAGNYAYQGFGTVPFTAWDVSDAAHPRQINVAFVQNNGDTTDTTPPRWLPGPGDDPANGGREYLAALLSTYSETELPAYTSLNFLDDAGSFDAMYLFWLSRVKSPTFATDGTYQVPRAGDVLRVELNPKVTEQDVFRFRVERLGEGEGSEVSNDLTRVRVVPNPYLAHSIYETSQFNRRVKFTHLPNVKLTVRIFNLAGDLVRTLVRSDVTQAELTWDLQNEARLPVASGVYIYHVDAPGVGSTVGRMAVFLEREKINFF